MPPTSDNLFGSIIANGSLEHFVTPFDALNRKQDVIYKKLFAIVKRISLPEARFVTTAIHFKRFVDPSSILVSPFSHPKRSDLQHYSFVLGSLGCYYPSLGQLEKCAEGLFTLEKEVDGTEDYRITSEYWLNRLWPASLKSLNFWKCLFKNGITSPRHTFDSLYQYLVTQSWNWQFRPDETGQAPTKLLRQTWKRID